MPSGGPASALWAGYNDKTVNQLVAHASTILNPVDAAAYNTECLAKHGDICIQPGATMWNGPEPNTYNYLKSGLVTNSSLYNSTVMDADLAATMSAVSESTPPL